MRVERIVQALQQRGFSVWWDQNIQGGQRFARAIATELAQAGAVIVVWSHLSVESEWVADEAQEAKDLGKIVPILVDDVRPPLGFRSVQTLSLMDWDGQASHPRIQALFDAIDLHLSTHTIAATDETWTKADPGPRERPGFKLEAAAQTITAPTSTNAQEGIVRPSIAALAFENRSGDPEQEYFCDGLVEDVIVTLARFKDLRVIACSSSFSYKGRTVDLGQVGQELDAQYVLTGSVRKAGKRIRLTAQLVAIDGLESAWSEQFDAELDDVFEVQDRLAQAIAAQIFPSISKSQLQQITRKRPADLSAWDLSLKAQQAASSGTADGFKDAREYAAQALAMDPECMSALVCNAWCHISEAWLNFATEPAQSVALGIEAARKAVALDGDDAQAFAYLGYGLFYAGQHEQGLSHLRTAVELNRNAAFGWQIYGMLLTYAGAADEALNALQQAAELSPRDRNRHVWIASMGVAAFDKGCYEKAIEYHREAIAINPEFAPGYRGLAADLSATGRMQEARAVLRQLKALQPGWTVAQTSATIPFANAQLRDRYLAALTAAGMPLN